MLGDLASVRIPDTIDPTIGWRSWQAKWSFGDRALLVSPDRNDFVWSGGGQWSDAVCEHGAGSDCQCGFNAFISERQLLTSQYMLNRVWGQVELAGEVREFPLGYRAQMARPLKLYVRESDADLAEALAGRYGCEVEIVDPDQMPVHIPPVAVDQAPDVSYLAELFDWIHGRNTYLLAAVTTLLVIIGAVVILLIERSYHHHVMQAIAHNGYYAQWGHMPILFAIAAVCSLPAFLIAMTSPSWYCTIYNMGLVSLTIVVLLVPAVIEGPGNKRDGYALEHYAEIVSVSEHRVTLTAGTKRTFSLNADIAQIRPGSCRYTRPGYSIEDVKECRHGASVTITYDKARALRRLKRQLASPGSRLL